MGMREDRTMGCQRLRLSNGSRSIRDQRPLFGVLKALAALKTLYCGLRMQFNTPNKSIGGTIESFLPSIIAHCHANSHGREVRGIGLETSQRGSNAPLQARLRE